MTASKTAWRCWANGFGFDPPPVSVPIALSRDYGQTVQAVVLKEDLYPEFNIANLWWRIWPWDEQ